MSYAPVLPEVSEIARDLIVIPARFGSKRLPGKPLIPIMGRTLLERVISIAQRAASLSGDASVLVATDDLRIAAHAADLGCAVAMTAASISSGSGRACAAALDQSIPPEIVVNLQGDAPFVAPETVAALISAARESRAAVATPVVRLDWNALDRMRDHKRIALFSGTTCTRRADGRALWFSKAIIPALRDEAVLRSTTSISPIYRHLGLYAYRLPALQEFQRTPPTVYELLEGLEQLRFLEMGLDILTVEVAPVAHAMSGIDTAEDVVLAETLIARHGDPYVSWR
jgi:3-deoxy-manno-octulosonate cytidylyltransferase (CMP-KDO synthetase)